MHIAHFHGECTILLNMLIDGFRTLINKILKKELIREIYIYLVISSFQQMYITSRKERAIKKTTRDEFEPSQSYTKNFTIVAQKIWSCHLLGEAKQTSQQKDQT